MASPIRLQSVIIEQLAGGEMRVLSLVVAVRRTLGRSEKLKGDLAAMVKSSLKTLVAAKTVVDDDGVYSLASSKSQIRVAVSD